MNSKTLQLDSELMNNLCEATYTGITHLNIMAHFSLQGDETWIPLTSYHATQQKAKGWKTVSWQSLEKTFQTHMYGKPCRVQHMAHDALLLLLAWLLPLSQQSLVQGLAEVSSDT